MGKDMAKLPAKREIAFQIMDVARMLRTYADQRARQFGISRAQWAVLMRIERTEGLKQTELAEILDLQPISLTRLLDRLAANGLIERRPDPNDRRANRLYLKPAARPLLDQLAELGTDMMATVLDGLDGKTIERILSPEHDVTVVTSAALALLKIDAGERFDALLSDLMMPEMTGMELYERLLRSVPDQAARMSFMTGGAFSPQAAEFLAKDSIRSIEKPFKGDGLREFLWTVLK